MKTIADLIAHIVSECTAVDREERFNAMLDECYSFEKVGGPFESMQPSRVLLECDPIAHRCGVNDYMDGEAVTEINGDEYEDAEIEKARAEFVDELEEELSGLESELDEANDQEDADGDPDIDEEDVKRIEAEIVALSTFIKECENYSF